MFSHATKLFTCSKLAPKPTRLESTTINNTININQNFKITILNQHVKTPNNQIDY